MNNITAVICRIASTEGISPQEVLFEMQAAIDACYDSEDPAVQARWATMPFKCKPTPEALIAYLAEKITKQG